MSFTLKDLRYNLEGNFPALVAYLRSHAEHALGPLRFDENEVETVVWHAIEQLVKLNVLGTGDSVPQTALDQLAPAQFYKFLNQMVARKAIDRLRKRRMLVPTMSELAAGGAAAEENDPVSEFTESIWGVVPFRTPEEIVLELISNEQLRNQLKECINSLKSAPRQYQAVIQTLKEDGAVQLLQELLGVAADNLSAEPVEHLSQHKDHAYRKLRQCLQKQSPNLIVKVASRLSLYGVRSPRTQSLSVDIQTLMENEEGQKDLSEDEVRKGLKQLAAGGLLSWTGEKVVQFTLVQKKQLERFYREE